MALTVTCGADIVLSYSAHTQLQSLYATASTTGAAFRWRLISAPSASTALSETRGSFVNGRASGASPSFVTEAGIEGTYVFECSASFGESVNNPGIDRENAQQCIIIKSEKKELYLLSDYQYQWGQYNLSNLNIVANGWPTTLAELNSQITDATLDDSSASRGSNTHALDSMFHTGTVTLAELNTMISDGSVDDSSSSRPPSGSANGDLSGTYPSPTVAKINGESIDLSGASSGDICVYNTLTSTWENTPFTERTTFLALNDTPSSYVTASGQLYVMSDRPSVTVEHAPINGICRQNFPTLNCLDYLTINALALPSHSSTLRLVLSDQNMYTATSPLTCVLGSTGYGGRVSADAVSTGWWHVFAVNNTANLGKFKLILKWGGTDTTAAYDHSWLGAEGLSACKYLHSIRCGNSGTGQIFPFTMAGKWNYWQDLYTSGASLNPWGMRLLYWEAAGVTQDTWFEFDGTNPPKSSGSSDATNITNIVPPGPASAIMIKHGSDLDYNENFYFDIFAGTKIQADAQAPLPQTAAFSFVTSTSKGTYDSRDVVSDIFPLDIQPMLCWNIHNALGGSTTYIDLNSLGWYNRYYGDSETDDFF